MAQKEQEPSAVHAIDAPTVTVIRLASAGFYAAHMLPNASTLVRSDFVIADP